MQSRILAASDSFFRLLRQSAGVLVPVVAFMIYTAASAHAQTGPGLPQGLELDVMFSKFVSNISAPLIKIINAGAYIFGVYLVGKGLFKAVKHADEGSKGQKLGGVFGTVLIGALLCYMPSFFDQVGITLFPGADANGYGGDTHHLLDYASVPTDVKQKMNNAYQAVIVFLQILGMVSFVRGLSILRSVTDGNTQVTSMAGITHVLAGAIAWNFGDFVQMIGTTIGYTLIS